MAGVLCLVSVIPAYADDISDTKQEGNKLEERKEQLVEEQKTLTEQLTKVLEEMQEMEKKLAAKDAEIEAAEEEYVQAKLEEARQYDKMKMRIRFMYENGDSQMLEVLFEAKVSVILLIKQNISIKYPVQIGRCWTHWSWS